MSSFYRHQYINVCNGHYTVTSDCSDCSLANVQLCVWYTVAWQQWYYSAHNCWLTESKSPPPVPCDCRTGPAQLPGQLLTSPAGDSSLSMSNTAGKWPLCIALLDTHHIHSLIPQTYFLGTNKKNNINIKNWQRIKQFSNYQWGGACQALVCVRPRPGVPAPGPEVTRLACWQFSAFSSDI